MPFHDAPLGGHVGVFALVHDLFQRLGDDPCIEASLEVREPTMASGITEQPVRFRVKFSHRALLLSDLAAQRRRSALSTASASGGNTDHFTVRDSAYRHVNISANGVVSQSNSEVYGPDPREDQRRYSPAQCLGAEKQTMIGNPAAEHISTSYIERSNLTLRMANRRFTRLTNAFSKKLANNCHMIALYTVWYNFVKMHKAVRMSPALTAGVVDKLWSMDDLVALVDAHDAAKPRRKPGRKPKHA